jgi:LuxR family transcriptional regulator, quorum-sensing system regulator SolR
MPLPANFDSVSLDGVISDWLCALREFSVESLLVLGPDPFGGQDDRLVLALHPPRLLEAAEALAESRDFGAPWRDSDAPLVAWQDISKSAFENQSRWRRLWLAHGYQSVVRIAFPMTVGRAFECYLFSPRQWHDRSEAARERHVAAVQRADCQLSHRQCDGQTEGRQQAGGGAAGLLVRPDLTKVNS